jgi:tetratricopeptide (TPR) repeat protein
VTHTTTENEPSVDEIVEQLTAGNGESEEACSLEDQVQHAAKEINSRTAQSHCHVLLEFLADNPQAVRELEALMILGLAHPGVFESENIPLAQEGRRLAHLLELDGQADRAQALLEAIVNRTPGDRLIDHELASMMRRTGNADRLIERYMRRAEDAVASGKTKEAISWLQEILLVDRSRRDVGRMIRDLRWGDQEKRVKWRSRIRLAAFVMITGILVTLVIQRESEVTRRYESLPEASTTDLASMRHRVEQLDLFAAQNPFSWRLYEASRERARLKVVMTQLESASAQIQIARKSEREAQLAIAESARKQGRIYAQQNRFPEALEQFERALADGPAEWDQRKQIQIDVAAIREWIATHGNAAVGSTK